MQDHLPVLRTGILVMVAKPSVKLLTQATIFEDEEENYEIDLTYVGGAGGAVCTFSFVDEKVITEIDLEHEEVLHVRTEFW